MGHNLIPSAPAGRKWATVNTLLSGGALPAAVATAAFQAVKGQLQNAAADPVYAEAVRILAGIPAAGRAPDFMVAVRELGLPVADKPDPTDLIFAIGDWLDHVARDRRGGDFGELSRRALTGALSSFLQGESIQPATGESGAAPVAQPLTSPSAFTTLTRRFYQRLLSEMLSSFLDRSLASHVGPDKRFSHAGELSVFNDDIARHCSATTGVIEEFARGWHARRVQVGEGVTAEDATAFGSFALGKLFAELEQRP